MFAPSEDISAHVLMRIPEALRRSGVSSWMSRRGRVGCFIEGPAFDRDGNLYLVDLPFGRTLRLDPQGLFEVVLEYDGGLNGLAIHADGSLWVADRPRAIVRIDPASGTWECVLSDVAGEPLKGPNDLTESSSGSNLTAEVPRAGLGLYSHA